MTLDELNTLFDAACSAQQRANSEDVTLWSCRGAGIRAVVLAIRDEMSGASRLRDIERLFQEILASDGVEAEPTVGQRLIKAAKEAAAIAKGEAPAGAPVCEWTDLGPEWSSACKVRFGAFASTKGRLFCPSCGKPISFKEGSE